MLLMFIESNGGHTVYISEHCQGFPLMYGRGRELGASVRCFKQCQLNKGGGAAVSAPPRLDGYDFHERAHQRADD